VIDNYKKVLGESIKGKIDDYQDVINRVEAGRKKQQQQPESEEQKKQSSAGALQMTEQISKGVMLSNQKLAIISQLGQDKYTQIYTFLR
jgi:hypothetical protein